MSIRKWDFPGPVSKGNITVKVKDKEKDINKAWNSLLMNLEGDGDITITGSHRVALLLEKTLEDLR